MAQTFSDEAIVLKAHNVGEADRLCILLCREKGKLAARAHGVRKLKSRKGGSVLPLQQIDVQIRKGKSGFTIVSANALDTHSFCRDDIRAFAHAVQGVSLLLKFLEDEEPVPEIYDLTTSFLTACESKPQSVVLSVFTLKLLDLLGMLPSMTHSAVSHHPFSPTDKLVYSVQYGGLCTHAEDPSGTVITADLYAFLRALHTTPLLPSSSLPAAHEQELSALTQSLLGNQLGSMFSPLSVASSS